MTKFITENKKTIATGFVVGAVLFAIGLGAYARRERQPAET